MHRATYLEQVNLQLTLVYLGNTLEPLAHPLHTACETILPVLYFQHVCWTSFQVLFTA
jgi:hypothetical protein